MCAFTARPTDLADPPPAIQQGKRPGNPVGGKAQPNSKGKFTRAGSVLGRSTEDVNDHYHFHEVGARTVTLRHDSRAPVLAPFRFQIARDASRGATTPDAARYPDAVSSRERRSVMPARRRRRRPLFLR
jgi:hypothetical protein